MKSGPDPSPLFDATEIRRLIYEGESRQVEFKESVVGGRIARTLCAFANTRGGVLLVGVTDRGRILGVARPPSVIERVAELARRVEPPVPVCAFAVPFATAPIVCCSVPLSGLRPHSVAAEVREVVVRIGASNRIASAAAMSAIGTPSTRRLVPTPLEARLLDELAALRGEGGMPEEIARKLGVGKQRGRQMLDRLECAGFLVAHGLGARRTYWRS